jgi:hypothetical protein
MQSSTTVLSFDIARGEGYIDILILIYFSLEVGLSKKEMSTPIFFIILILLHQSPRNLSAIFYTGQNPMLISYILTNQKISIGEYIIMIIAQKVMGL